MTFRKTLENSYPPIEVHVTRGNFTESVHLVDAVVVDEHGLAVANFGLGETCVTYPRSAIKMLQAISFVESGAVEAYGLSDRHLSIACASHNGEHAHTNLVMDWLGQMGFAESELVCGPHFPYDEKTARELVRMDQAPQRRHNNCSGKHTSMLTTMKKLGWDSHHYEAYDHDLQIRLRNVLSELSGEDIHRAPWGIDGCGIPTYAMSLGAMARSIGALLPNQALTLERKEACRMIREAVLSQPYFIGGTGDFCSDLMALAQGRLVVKTGAEGVYAGVMLREGLSFSMKVRDGNARASRVAVGALLRAFNGITDHDFLQLSSHTQPPVKNWEGLTVGKIFVPHPLMG
jgi:L-asparaginase II